MDEQDVGGSLVVVRDRSPSLRRRQTDFNLTSPERRRLELQREIGGDEGKCNMEMDVGANFHVTLECHHLILMQY